MKETAPIAWLFYDSAPSEDKVASRASHGTPLPFLLIFVGATLLLVVRAFARLVVAVTLVATQFGRDGGGGGGGGSGGTGGRHSGGG